MHRCIAMLWFTPVPYIADLLGQASPCLLSASFIHLLVATTILPFLGLYLPPTYHLPSGLSLVAIILPVLQPGLILYLLLIICQWSLSQGPFPSYLIYHLSLPSFYLLGFAGFVLGHRWVLGLHFARLHFWHTAIYCVSSFRFISLGPRYLPRYTPFFIFSTISHCTFLHFVHCTFTFSPRAHIPISPYHLDTLYHYTHTTCCCIHLSHFAFLYTCICCIPLCTFISTPLFYIHSVLLPCIVWLLFHFTDTRSLPHLHSQFLFSFHFILPHHHFSPYISFLDSTTIKFSMVLVLLPPPFPALPLTSFLHFLITLQHHYSPPPRVHIATTTTTYTTTTCKPTTYLHLPWPPPPSVWVPVLRLLSVFLPWLPLVLVLDLPAHVTSRLYRFTRYCLRAYWVVPFAVTARPSCI